MKMNKYVVAKDIHLPLTANSLEAVVIKKGEVWEETDEEPAAWSARKCCMVLRRLSDGHESVFNKALIGEYLKTVER